MFTIYDVEKEHYWQLSDINDTNLMLMIIKHAKHGRELI
jgi:hypothetical protein